MDFGRGEYELGAVSIWGGGLDRGCFSFLSFSLYLYFPCQALLKVGYGLCVSFCPLSFLLSFLVLLLRRGKFGLVDSLVEWRN